MKETSAAVTNRTRYEHKAKKYEDWALHEASSAD